MVGYIINVAGIVICSILWYINGRITGKRLGKQEAYDEMLAILEDDMSCMRNEVK